MARNLSSFLFKRSKGYESDLLQNAAFSRTSNPSWYYVDQNYVVTKILEIVRKHCHEGRSFFIFAKHFE